MKKIFLSLYSNDLNASPALKISAKRPQEDGIDSFVRSSPLYQIGNSLTFDKVESDFSGVIVLLYSIQPLSIYNQLIKEREITDKQVKMYLSHGFSSLVLFVSDSSFKFDRFKFEKAPVWYEMWHVNNNIIVSSENNFVHFSSKKNIDINISRLNAEEQFIFSDIISSLNYAYTYADILLTAYIPILDEVKRKVLDCYYRSLYLDKKIDFEHFANKTKEVNDRQREYVEKLLTKYKDIENDSSIESVFIKDEIVQIASALKNSNSQLFGNIPVVKYGTHQSGNNSLLGIGHHVVGFLSVYLHIRECLDNIDFEKVFEDTYSKIKSPPLLLKLADDSYNNWYSKFVNANGLDDFIEYRDKNSTHLMMYFSNRQGFRLTKHSVSAAMQSLSLSYLPSFTLNTLTHELLHAHVKAEIMTEMYPVTGNRIVREAFDIYKEVFDQSSKDYTIKQFIQINFLFIAEMLKDDSSNYEKRKITRSYDETALVKTLKKWYKEVEEIIVHILDLLYFYNSDVNLYTKAIWISWLSLPFSVNYLEDYILRTICSITAVEKNSDRRKRFDWAIDILRKQLCEIKNIEFVNSTYVDLVLKYLSDEKNVNKIRYQYTSAFVTLVDITEKFFFSSGLKSRLNQDNNLVETAGSVFSYNIDVDDYEDRIIESPIGLINEINRLNISNIENLNLTETCEIERRSMWLNSLITTSLKKYKNDS